MKLNICIPALLIILGFYAVPAFSQFNPVKGTFQLKVDDNPTAATQSNNPVSYATTSGIECTANSFWAITGTGIDQFTLNEGLITKVGTTTLNGAFDLNLAYCNNLNGGGFGPTFYSTTNFNQPAYFDGTVVVNTQLISPDRLINCGGNGNFLYYIMYDASFRSKAIERYDGTSLTSVYSIPDTIMTTVADIAVDDNGNVWLFTGPRNESVILTDTITVVSPGGSVLKQFPFSFNTDNAFGCFLLNGKLYLGLGGANPIHPYSIVPIVLSTGSVSLGEPIPMPVTTGYADMASCSAGNPLSIDQNNELAGISVFPIPFKDELAINSSKYDFLEVVIYDITSREVIHQYFTQSVTLHTEQLLKGMYIYKITNAVGDCKTGKILKE